jgi:hypothetical protein
MKEFNVDIPNIADIYNQQISMDEAIDVASKMKEDFSKLVSDIVECRLVPFLLKHPEIENMMLDLEYSYNDEGYAPINVMPWFNDNWDTYYTEDEEELRSEVDHLFDDIAGLLLEDIKINSAELLAKYHAIKLDNALISKATSKKIKNKL